jgi:hypothetical protein
MRSAQSGNESTPMFKTIGRFGHWLAKVFRLEVELCNSISLSSQTLHLDSAFDKLRTGSTRQNDHGVKKTASLRCISGDGIFH